MRKIVRLSSLILIVFLTIGIAVPAQTTPEIMIGDDTESPYELPVSLSSAPNGLFSFNIKLSVADTSVAKFTDATISSQFSSASFVVDVASDGSWIQVAAGDFNENIGAGATDVLLGTLELSSEGTGSTTVSVDTLIELLDDQGSSIDAATSDTGTVSSVEIPAAPSNLTATAISPGQINLTWSDNSDNEDEFRIYRNGSQVDTVGSNTSSYSDTGLSSYTQYCYKVSAYNSAGESSKSNQACATTKDGNPPNPNPLTWATEPNVTGPNTTEMTATSATDSEGNGVEYYFEETTGNSGGNDSNWQDDTTYADSGLESGTEYCYRVKARDKSSNQNDTDWSDEKRAVTSNQPPTASFSADPTSGEAPLDVSFDASGSSDPDGNINSYNWDFGDGSTGSGETTSHTFDSAGYYTVELTVTDNDGASDTGSETISVSQPNQPPEAAFTYTPYDPSTDESITFDASNSSDPDGSVDTYKWDWTNDGSYDTTTSSATTDHSYQDAGTYTVKLQVVDDDGTTDTATKELTVSNVAPTADFYLSPESPFVDEKIDFVNESSDPENSIEEYNWVFGDGDFSSKENPTHEYKEALTFTVKLTVEDDHGLTDSVERKVKVSNPKKELQENFPNSPGDVENPDQFIGQKEAQYAVWSFLSGEKVSGTERSFTKEVAREILSYHLMDKEIPQESSQGASESAKKAARKLSQTFLHSPLPIKVSNILTDVGAEKPVEELTIEIYNLQGKLKYKDRREVVDQSNWSSLVERIRTELEAGPYLYLIEVKETDGELRRTKLRKLWVE